MDYGDTRSISAKLPAAPNFFYDNTNDYRFKSFLREREVYLPCQYKTNTYTS